jgi:hypothetical protein
MILKSPPLAHSAQQHYAPTMPEQRRSQDGRVNGGDGNSRDTPPKSPEREFFGGSRETKRGRKWDHAPQSELVTEHAGVLQISSPWRTFMKSSMYGSAPSEDRKGVDNLFLDEQTPGYVQPWRGDVQGRDREKALGLTHRKLQKSIWHQRIRVGTLQDQSLTITDVLQRVIVMHPLIPLFFRVIVFTTSTITLGISASIYDLTDCSSFPQTPSTVMAIVVDVVSMPYIGYNAWDEYTGKPLGLRSPKVKMRFMLFDLLFIVLGSVNLVLAFNSLLDENSACKEGENGTDYDICSRLQTLSAFLFFALVAWSLPFSFCLLRYVINSKLFRVRLLTSI